MNLASCSEVRSDQSGVWAGIAEKSRRMGAHSPSSASDAMFVSSQTKIKTYLEAFAPPTKSNWISFLDRRSSIGFGNF
ncbi:MAG: hypothetical protein F4039_10460 [Gammaproteobacteria bacterium]|nr:hypothetical protein [Gammaproteobacteria bacterium]